MTPEQKADAKAEKIVNCFNGRQRDWATKTALKATIAKAILDAATTDESSEVQKRHATNVARREAQKRENQIKAHEAIIEETSDVVDDMHARIKELEAALSPFAKFARSLFNGRRGVPVSGAWYSLDPGAPSEAEITVEHLKAARAVLEKGEKE